MRIRQLIITVIAAGTIGTGMTSCTSKFDDYNTDQNATTTVTPGMLATNLIIGMMDMGGAKYSVYDNMRNKQIAWAVDTHKKFPHIVIKKGTTFSSVQK